MAERELGARPKQRGRIVPSRYMQYERKTAGKAASDTRGAEQMASRKNPPTDSQRHRIAAETTPGMLQSTLVESHGCARPDLELSAINDKSCHKMPLSKSTTKGPREKRQTLASSSSGDLIDMLDSQALLMTYASIKIEKNLARLEEEAERNLLTLSEEVGRLQREAHTKKRKLKRWKQELALTEALEKQVEALSPVAKQSARFEGHYKPFATALDSTRHHLPVKDVYTGQDKEQYLDELQAELVLTQKVLSRRPREQAGRNGDARRVVKELEEAALQVDAELPRTFAQVVELSAGVSKEASLHFQKVCEDSVGLESVRPLYFGSSARCIDMGLGQDLQPLPPGAQRCSLPSGLLQPDVSPPGQGGDGGDHRIVGGSPATSVGQQGAQWPKAQGGKAFQYGKPGRPGQNGRPDEAAYGGRPVQYGRPTESGPYGRPGITIQDRGDSDPEQYESNTGYGIQINHPRVEWKSPGIPYIPSPKELGGAYIPLPKGSTQYNPNGPYGDGGSLESGPRGRDDGSYGPIPESLRPGGGRHGEYNRDQGLPCIPDC